MTGLSALKTRRRLSRFGEQDPRPGSNGAPKGRRCSFIRTDGETMRCWKDDSFLMTRICHITEKP